MTLQDLTKGVEFLFVNSVTATIIANWEMITNGLQVILVITAIIYNIVKIYSWYEHKFKNSKLEEQEDEFKEDI